MAGRYSDTLLLLLLLTLTSLTLCGCGGSTVDRTPAPISSADVFDLNSMTGQTWTFQDGYGDHMFISIEDPPAGFYPGCSVWHYTKDNARGYWQSGAPEAELHFVICQEPDGAWRCNASLVSWTGLLLTQDVDASGDGKTPYLIIPPDAVPTTTLVDDTAYVSYILSGQITWDSVRSLVAPTLKTWRTESSIENVVTPAYSGPALVSEQWEAWSAPCFPHERENPGCAHEKWYFAPDSGLVKVIPIQSGAPTFDPNLVMVRIK